MRPLVPLALVVLANLATACKVVPASPEETANSRASVPGPSLGAAARIEAGASASWDGGRITVAFDSVSADSRCPADAMCAWEGDAVARIRLSAGERRAEVGLHTNLEPKQASFAGYVVRLVNVEPYPGTYDRSKPAPPAVAVVVVTRG